MKLLSILVALCFAIPSMAARKDEWQALDRLRTGDSIEVVAGNGREKGEFVSSSTESLMIRTNAGEKRFERAGVVQVISRSSSRRLSNIVIGAGIGLAISGVTDGTLGVRLRNEGSNERALIWTLPVAAGAGVGAVLPAHKTIYKR